MEQVGFLNYFQANQRLSQFFQNNLKFMDKILFRFGTPRFPVVQGGGCSASDHLTRKHGSTLRLFQTLADLNDTDRKIDQAIFKFFSCQRRLCSFLKTTSDEQSQISDVLSIPDLRTQIVHRSSEIIFY